LFVTISRGRAFIGLLLCILMQQAHGAGGATPPASGLDGGLVPAAKPATVIPGTYKPLRYDEDYRYLKATPVADLWDPVKYIPLGGSGYLSLGGEIRERFEDYSAANFGVPGRTADSYLLHRVLVHADLHMGEHVRAFLQVGSHRAFGKNAAAPPYSDRLDLQQAFLDLRLPGVKAGESAPILRLGRQEMAFGSQRLVSIRDAPNLRRAFDGVRMSGSVGQTQIDAFVTRPVLPEEGNFDDKSNDAQKFWGVYTTTAATGGSNSGVDLYYLGFENKRALYSIGSGYEKRHSIGARVFGHAGRWDWDWEGLGQFGSFSLKNIRAWGFALDTGYTLAGEAWKPRGGIKITVGSGNRNPNGGTLRTYGPLFPKLAYFNQAGLVGAPNVIDLQPSLTFKPAASMKVTAVCDFVWRQATSDAVYTSLGTPIPRTAGRAGRHSGNEPSIDFTWQANRHLFINAGVVHVDVARILAEAGAHNTNFVYFSVAYTF
jgi:hypothetical protein